MAKKPKTPKFQGLPTLEDLARRRGQSVAAVLADWGVADADALRARLQREGLAQVEDPGILFPATLTVDVKAKKIVPLDSIELKVAVERPKVPESKKAPKGKLTSDAADSGTKDRAGDEPAPVVGAADGAAAGKA